MSLGARSYASCTMARALAAWRCAWDGTMLVAYHRYALYMKQRGRCYLCIKPMRGADGPRDLWVSRDHVFPQAVGGHAESNILLAHRKCNHEKDARWPTPCEVIFLAGIYAAPFNAIGARLRKARRRAELEAKRRAKIEEFR